MSDTTSTSKFNSKSLFSAGGLILVLVILVLINVIFSQVNLRWDLTEDNLYSLSSGSHKIISDLDREVVIKYFYSQGVENMPVHIQNYAKRVADFLAEYENAGEGKITVETYNPEPDSVEEEWAVRYGIEGADLPTGDRVYFGLVALSADQEEAIPMLDPAREQQLEYDLTRLIARVQSPNKPQIGIISSLPVFGGPAFNMGRPAQGSDPWLFIQELRKTYGVEEIDAAAESIPEGTDLLLLIHPKNLSEGLQYAVDQYVLSGGNLIVFADPFAVSDSAQQGGPQPSGSLDRLFAAWGVDMDMGKVLLDFDYMSQLRTQDNQIEDNPLWISLQESAFNDQAIITAQLESMLMPMAGAVQKAADSTYEYEPVVQSSANSALTDTFRVRFGVEQIRRDFSPTPETYDLAVKVSGTFKSAFPDGKPEAESEGEETVKSTASENPDEAGHLSEGKQRATLLLVGDADLLFDNFYVNRQNFLGFNISRMFNDNLNFLLNSSEMLTGSEALISLRTRGKFERPFTRVEELEKIAQARWMEREQELVRQAEETNRMLRQLEQQKDASQELILSPEQEAEVQKFQEERRRINRELKVVRRNLRSDIESLGNTIKFLNIFLMVLVVALAGLGYGLYRRNKSTRS